MKRLKILYVLAISLMFFAPYLYIINCIAFPGDGDCSKAHGIFYIDVSIDNDAEIIVDGIPSEEFWTEISNRKAKVEIKLAETRVGEEIPEIYSLNATFIINNEFLLILCQWQDHTPGFDYPPDQDGIAFCWNINTPNFSAYYATDMNTLHMGNGSVDAWRWTYDDNVLPGAEHLCVDDCFDENGWIFGNPEAKNINVAYTYNTNSYTLEMKRKLITNEIYDVQFNEKKIYKFNVAILNDSHGIDHATSWTYAIDLREPEKVVPGFNLEYLILVTFITISLIFIIKCKQKFQVN